MARGRITLSYIPNYNARKNTYNKRKIGFLKKVEELTILCDIEIGVIIYSNFEDEPVVWPSRERVQEIVACFKRLNESDKNCKITDREAVVSEMASRLGNQLLMLLKDNKHMLMLDFCHQFTSGEQLLSLNEYDLNDLGWAVNQCLDQLIEKHNELSRVSSTSIIPQPQHSMSQQGADQVEANNSMAQNDQDKTNL